VFAQRSHAGLFTLVDDNSSASFDTASSANMFNWLVDGVDHLFQQAFWFRVGNVAETSLHTLPIALEGTTDTDFDGNHEHLYVRYNGAGFIAEVNYALDGGSLGSGASDVGEQITITSTTSLPLDFHFFQYVDLEINATALNDLGFFADPHAVVQYDASLRVAETADAPEPDHREIDFFDVIRNKLNDGLATTLSDTPAVGTVIGPGDLTWAFQWDFTLPPQGSFQISKDKIISVVPEPTAIALLGFGAGLLFSVRRKR
jgi:PEP-CTERM motif